MSGALRGSGHARNPAGAASTAARAAVLSSPALDTSDSPWTG